MVPARISHKTECSHPQTPHARRKCRKARIAAEEATMSITTVQVETRTKNWRGDEKITIEEYTQIEGTITATSTDANAQPGAGHMPIYTVSAGTATVTVANPQMVASDMRPVRVGDRVRILATTPCDIADYAASTVERI